MKDVGIVTDSGASIPEELIAAFELHVVPMGIQMDGRVIRDGIDLDRAAFYQMMDDVSSMTTSQPSPGDFVGVYRQAADKARELISIHITSKASGTFQVANLVKETLPFKITTFDSASCSMGQGFMVLEAASAALQGKSSEEILALLEKLKERVAVYAMVPTLKYLSRSGKVSKVKALLASMLHIKPIIGMQEGVAEVMAKVRSHRKALDQLIALIEERFPGQTLNVAILHTDVPQKAEQFRELVEARLSCAKVTVAEMGTALAVHGGKGMVGIAAYPADQNGT